MILFASPQEGQSYDLRLQMKTLRFREVKSFAQGQTIRKMAEAGFELRPHLTP